ncbi:MAG: hypothetical protein RIQ33_1709, partial [Bacteroidota bacterium]
LGESATDDIVPVKAMFSASMLTVMPVFINP